MVIPILKLLRTTEGIVVLNLNLEFRIGLHISDRPLLVLIRNRLGLGKNISNKYRKYFTRKR